MCLCQLLFSSDVSKRRRRAFLSTEGKATLSLFSHTFSRSLSLSASFSSRRRSNSEGRQPCRLAAPRGAPRRAELLMLMLQRPAVQQHHRLLTSTLAAMETTTPSPSLRAASPLPLISRGRRRRRGRNWLGETFKRRCLRFSSAVALSGEREKNRERESSNADVDPHHASSPFLRNSLANNRLQSTPEYLAWARRAKVDPTLRVGG